MGRRDRRPRRLDALVPVAREILLELLELLWLGPPGRLLRGALAHENGGRRGGGERDRGSRGVPARAAVRARRTRDVDRADGRSERLRLDGASQLDPVAIP